MAVNATAQAGVIEELEGAALHDSSLDPQGSGPAFKVLKQLVSNWLTDAVQNHNRYAATFTADNHYCNCLIIAMVLQWPHHWLIVCTPVHLKRINTQAMTATPTTQHLKH